MLIKLSFRFVSRCASQIIMLNEKMKFVFAIVYKITEMMMGQLRSNKNYSTDCSETLDLVFLRLALYKNDKRPSMWFG